MLGEIIETGFALSLFVNAVLYLPQIIRIVRKKTAKGISLITFFGFWFILLWTVFHGFLRKDYLLAYGTLLSLIPCGWIVIQIIWYRFKKKEDV